MGLGAGQDGEAGQEKNQFWELVHREVTWVQPAQHAGAGKFIAGWLTGTLAGGPLVE
jgi:hypothetical protein